uniref:Uncharacterized protein n=1 Tax=Triticum urartu TaxID=4572 RepID=A0A8R7UGC0_TRIUA
MKQFQHSISLGQLQEGSLKLMHQSSLMLFLILMYLS